MDQEHIKIRMATEEDARALLDIYAPYVRDTAVTFEWEVPSTEEFAARIHTVLQKYPYLVAEWEGVPAGYAYAGPFHSRAAYAWSAETSVYVERSRKKQGIGRRLYEALEEMLREQGILNLYACVAYPCGGESPYLDKNSAEFHMRMGYRLVGEFRQCGYKFGRWHNMVWMEKHIGEHTKPQNGSR